MITLLHIALLALQVIALHLTVLPLAAAPARCRRACLPMRASLWRQQIRSMITSLKSPQRPPALLVPSGSEDSNSQSLTRNRRERSAISSDAAWITDLSTDCNIWRGAGQRSVREYRRRVVGGPHHDRKRDEDSLHRQDINLRAERPQERD